MNTLNKNASHISEIKRVDIKTREWKILRTAKTAKKKERKKEKEKESKKKNKISAQSITLLYTEHNGYSKVNGTLSLWTVEHHPYL